MSYLPDIIRCVLCQQPVKREHQARLFITETLMYAQPMHGSVSIQGNRIRLNPAKSRQLQVIYGLLGPGTNHVICMECVDETMVELSVIGDSI